MEMSQLALSEMDCKLALSILGMQMVCIPLFLYIRENLIFYKVTGDSILIIYYLFNIEKKDNRIFIPKKRINEIIYLLNKFVIGYSSDSRIISCEYELINS